MGALFLEWSPCALRRELLEVETLKLCPSLVAAVRFSCPLVPHVFVSLTLLVAPKQLGSGPLVLAVSHGVGS